MNSLKQWLSDGDSKTSRPEKYISLIVFAVVGTAIYASGFEGKYFADDFKHVFSLPASKVFYFFSNPNPHSTFYRPIEAMILATIQSVFGLNTLPIHLFALGLHILLTWFVFLASVSLGFSRPASLIGSSYMLLSQANALAVLSNDSISQVASVLCGCVSLWLLWMFMSNGSGFPRRRYYVFSLVVFSLSLLMKEVGLGFLPALLAVLWVGRKGVIKNYPHILRTIRLTLPFVLVALLYLAVHKIVVTAEPASRYDIALGMNIVQNLSLLAISASIPLSSVAAFVAYRTNDMVLLTSALVGITILTLIVLRGIILSKHKRALLFFLALGIVVLSPAILIVHASELYVYAALPMLSIVIGVAGSTVFKRSNHAARLALLGFALMVTVSHVGAIQSKACLLYENGERASILLPRIEPFIHQLPPHGTLVLLNPPEEYVEYSVYLMKGFRVFSFGENIFKFVSHRDDITVRAYNEVEFENWMPHAPVQVLSLGKNLSVVVDENRRTIR